MAIPTWPADLPYAPLRDPWQGAPVLAPLATDMEGGNTRNRSRPGDDVAVFPWSRRFTPDQASAWKAFLAQIKANGWRWVMPVCIDHVSYETRMVQMVSGTLAYADVRGRLQVTFQLRILPAGLLPPAPSLAIDAYITVTGVPGAPVTITIS